MQITETLVPKVGGGNLRYFSTFFSTELPKFKKFWIPKVGEKNTEQICYTCSPLETVGVLKQKIRLRNNTIIIYWVALMAFSKSIPNLLLTYILTRSVLKDHFGPLIFKIKYLMNFYFSKCGLNVSLCKTRCEFGIAIIVH